MKIELVAMGKLRDKHCRALMDEYLGRLSHYAKVEHTELREVRLTGGQAIDVALAQEALAMQARCTPNTVRIALDERGAAWTSQTLASQLEQWMVRGERHVALFVGSANGLDVGFRQGCEHQLALSAMTLPHELARVVLAEQLYRAMTILRGEPYHR